MKAWTRRALMGSLLAATAACSSTQFASTRGEIDTRVNNALSDLYVSVPGARELSQQAVATLVMPRMQEGSLIYGGAYGEGALLIQNATVDYYSAASASCGPPISPIMAITWVSSSFSNCSKISRNEDPLIGSPPIPTLVETPIPRSLSCAAAS